MSSEADVEELREALNAICPHEYAVDCDLPEHEAARAGHAAITRISDRLQRYEAVAEAARVVRDYDRGFEELHAALLALDAEAPA